MAGDHLPVRVTATNSGPDSKGMVSVFGWELEGMVAFYLVGGAVGGVFLLLFVPSESLLLRGGIAAIPVAGTALWVKLFIAGKPPGYQSNLFEKWLKGKHFRLNQRKWTQLRHPRSVVLDGILLKDLNNG